MHELCHQAADEEPLLVIGWIPIPELAQVSVLVTKAEGASQDLPDGGGAWHTLMVQH